MPVLYPINQKYCSFEIPHSNSSIASQTCAWLESLQPSTKHCICPSEAHIASELTLNGRQKRRREFELGRACAQSQLALFDEYSTIGVNHDRSPSWPSGIVGSISHSENWTWAAVARNSNVQSIGIDTETLVSSTTRSEIQHEIATPEELEFVEQVGLSPEQALTVIFSAKEAFYKCCYPMTQEFFDFKDAFVDKVTNTFLCIRTSPSHPNLGQMPPCLNVHFLVAGTDIFTFTWLE